MHLLITILKRSPVALLTFLFTSSTTLSAHSTRKDAPKPDPAWLYKLPEVAINIPDKVPVKLIDHQRLWRRTETSPYKKVKRKQTNLIPELMVGKEEENKKIKPPRSLEGKGYLLMKREQQLLEASRFKGASPSNFSPTTP